MNCLELLDQMNKNGIQLEDLEKLEEMDEEAMGLKVNTSADGIVTNQMILFDASSTAASSGFLPTSKSKPNKKPKSSLH